MIQHIKSVVYKKEFDEYKEYCSHILTKLTLKELLIIAYYILEYTEAYESMIIISLRG